MKLRSIECPADFRWMGPVITPADLSAVATARQIIAQAQARADTLMAETRLSVKKLQDTVRDDFLREYGRAFRQLLDEWQAERAQIHQNLTQYARQMAVITLQRLGAELSDEQRLDIVLRQILSETVPDIAFTLRVAVGAESLAEVRLQQLFTHPDHAHLAGLRYSIICDPALQSDAVILVGPQGSRISCSFEQLVQQLLLCL